VQGHQSEGLPFEALLAVIVAASVIMVPIWLFVATVTRLSAATREARLAAVRLAGGTQGQVRLLAGTEAGVGACIGSLLGIPLFLAVRTPLAGGAIGGIHLFPSDLTPPLPIAIGLLIALPALGDPDVPSYACAASSYSPVGVTRHARRAHAGWGWVPVLSVGNRGSHVVREQTCGAHAARNVEVMVLIGGSLVFLRLRPRRNRDVVSLDPGSTTRRSVRSVSAMLGCGASKPSRPP